MINVRIAIHVLAAIAAAITGGTVVFPNLAPGIQADIIAVASLVGIIAAAYLAATSTGVSKSKAG